MIILRGKNFMQFIFNTSHNVFLLLILLLFSIDVIPQNVSFEKVSYEKGLYQNTAYDIVQDKYGFLWLATPKGLIRYDGVNYNIFEQYESNGITEPIKRVYALYLNNSGDILVGSSSGIFKYDIDLEKVVKLSETHIHFNKSNYFVPCTKEDLLVCASSGVYHLSDAGTLSNIKVNLNGLLPPNENLRNLFFLKDSLYLYATFSGIGICKYNVLEKAITPLSYYHTNGVTHTLCKETESVFWLGLTNGLRRVKLSENGELEELDFSAYSNYQLLDGSIINEIYKASDGYIYAGSTGNGLIRINPSLKNIEVFRYDKKVKSSISWDNVFCIYEDHCGILWFGTGQGGLSKYDTNRKPFYHLKHNPLESNTLSHDHINSILVDSHNHLWIGTFFGGLNRSINNLNNSTFEELSFDVLSLDHMPGNLGHYSLIEINGYVLIGHGSTLYAYDLEKDTLTRINVNSELGKLLANKQIICFEIDNYDRLWIGCKEKVLCLDFNNHVENLIAGKVTKTPVQLKEINPDSFLRVNQITCTQDDHIYIATDIGLFHAKSKKELISLDHYYHKLGDLSSLSQNELTNIFEDSNHRIWIGTFYGGLNLVELDQSDNTLSFKHTQNGLNLQESSIFRIEEDSRENLWLSSYNGIFMYNTKDNTYLNYSTSDGLATNLFHKFSSFKTREGLMIFGSIFGLTAFHPELIKPNQTFPITSITKLSIFNQKVKIGEKLFGKVILPTAISNMDHIELPYECNMITLEFAGIQLSNPEKNSFQYKLEGIDADWILTSSKRNYANYTNLSPGKYTFKVSSSNSDNVQNPEIVELDITILPPWYQTTFAIITFSLIIICLFTLIFAYVRKMVFLKHELKYEKLEKSKEKELYEAKQSFFTNISHELKTPLSLILGPLEKLSNKLNLNESDQQTFSVINRNVNRLHQLINQIMDFRKLEQSKIELSLQNSDINLFIQNITVSFNEEMKYNKQHLKFEGKDETIYMNFDHDKVEKVIYNLLSNAIKHTTPNGEIRIKTQLITDQDMVEIFIMNDGEGIPENEKERIFERFYQLQNTETGTGIGLAMSQSFIEMHGGTIIETGTYGKNAIFKIELPLLDNDLETRNKVEAQSARALEDEAIHMQNNHAEEQEIVLVVEDNAEMLEFVSGILSNRFIVVKATDGVEGVKSAEEQIPSLIITDIMMPKMDGTELCRLLKENPKTAHIPIIMLTAKGTTEQKIEGLNVGADAYLTKPFQINHLEAQVDNLLESRKKIQKSLKEKYGIAFDDLNIIPADEKLIKDLISYIEENLSNPDLKMVDLAKEMSYSYIQFNRKMKAITGDSVGNFVNNYRLNHAKQVFEADPTRNISEVMYSVGFKNSSYFSRCFKEKFGKSPREFKESIR
ncbi:response regulator [Puteibacter caeruleilacunae]|nr:response regulator [Puteibacter caeruleilacunae]